MAKNKNQKCHRERSVAIFYWEPFKERKFNLPTLFGIIYLLMLFSLPHSAFAANYIDNGDGTVTDDNTGLMWQQEDDNSNRTWENAITYCEGLSLAGYSDWRLPNIKELESIVDDSVYSPSIDTTAFPSTNSSYYWSSTTYAYNTTDAWSVGFYDGYVYNFSKTLSYYVRCVRGGL